MLRASCFYYNDTEITGEKHAQQTAGSFIATLSSKIVRKSALRISEKLNLREALLIEQLLKKIKAISTGSLYGGKERGTAAAGSSGPGNVKVFPEQSFVKHTAAGYEDNYESGRDEENAGFSPAKNLEIESLKILINGLGEDFNQLLEIGAEHYRYEDTKKLYEVIRGIFAEGQKQGVVINFPLEISSNKLEGEQVKKLYNLIQFSPLNYSDYNLACREVLFNLKRLYLTNRAEEMDNCSKGESYNKNSGNWQQTSIIRKVKNTY